MRWGRIRQMTNDERRFTNNEQTSSPYHYSFLHDAPCRNHPLPLPNHSITAPLFFYIPSRHPINPFTPLQRADGHPPRFSSSSRVRPVGGRAALRGQNSPLSLLSGRFRSQLQKPDEGLGRRQIPNATRKEGAADHYQSQGGLVVK